MTRPNKYLTKIANILEIPGLSEDMQPVQVRAVNNAAKLLGVDNGNDKEGVTKFVRSKLRE